MRLRTAIVAALLFLSVPAAAQPADPAQADRELTEAGRWGERLGEALNVGAASLSELNAGMKALVTPPMSVERLVAGAPRLRPLIERNRADLRRSLAMLESLPPAPPLLADMAPRLVADARAQNAQISSLVDAFDDFLVAVGKSDLAALDRVMPKIMDGAFAMIAQQRLMVRSRQASSPPTDSNHQALAILGEIYRATEAVLRASTAAKQNGGARADPAAAALRRELGLVAAETHSLAAAGRRNLERELAEVDGQRLSGDPAEKRLMERVREVLAGEAKVFALADRLAAFAEANKGVTGAQLREPGRGRLLPVLTQMESDYMAVTEEQAAALARER